jgi:hypothetical protein
MAGRADRLATGLLSATLLVTAGGTVGCAGRSKEPRPLPPVTEMPKTPEEPPRPSEVPVATPMPPTMVVIDEGGDKNGPPPTLAQAAQAEKERRSRATKPTVVLDNKNLVEHGKDQKLTVAQGQPTKVDAELAAGAAIEDAEARDESYWRDRGLDIRKRWRGAVDRQEELQAQANSLRQRFYAADDPYLRDGRIKPEWDRVLNELDLSRREAEASAAELEAFLDEGRQAGVLPGWLREGAELEPEEKPLKAPTAEPREPVEATEPPGDPS